MYLISNHHMEVSISESVRAYLVQARLLYRTVSGRLAMVGGMVVYVPTQRGG
jgi:hypothetical protein